MDRDTFLNALTDYISVNREIISTLKSIRKVIEEHQKEIRAVRTLSTTCGVVSAASTVGIFFAPVTGGLSLILTGVAAGTAVGGLGAAVAGGLADHVKSKGYEKKIKDLQARHAVSTEKLNAVLEKLRKVVKLLESNGYSPEMATISTMTCLAHQLFDIGKGVKDIAAAAKTVDVCIQSAQVTKLLANVGVTVTTRVGSNGLKGYSVVFNSIEALNQPMKSEMAAISALARNPELISLGMKAIKALVFSVVDVGLLISSWNYPHPLAKAADDFIDKLEADCREKENQRKEDIKNIYAHTVIALHTGHVVLIHDTFSRKLISMDS